MTPARYVIPEHNLAIGNDSPVWFKPRRTVWFVVRGREIVKDRGGRNRYFSDAIKAAAFMERLAETEATP